jgi:hypothetical protein
MQTHLSKMFGQSIGRVLMKASNGGTPAEVDGHKGVWVTMQGRPIFIRDGESAGDALSRHTGGAAGKPGEKPAGTKPTAAKPGLTIMRERTVPPSGGHPPYAPNPEEDKDGDGVADASRVGIGGREVRPPPAIPRLPNLTPDERDVEDRFAKAFEDDPDGMAKEYLDRLKKGEIGDGPNVFGTDDAKLLSPDYNPSGATEDTVKDARGRYNVMVHQTGNAIAKRAFLMKLDEIEGGSPEGKTVLVTAGGVAAGKGYALGNVDQTKELSKRVGAIWDSAGEQNSTEMPWVLDECNKRGIKAVFAYVHADPKETWENPKRGVVERAQKKGRMVDAQLFADSYALGARNFDNFHRNNKDKADFIFLESGEPPRVVNKVPAAGLEARSEDIYARASKVLSERSASLNPAVKRGGSVGRRIWK